MDIKREVDSNDITECPHDDRPSTGMLCVSDAGFSTFICLHNMVIVLALSHFSTLLIVYLRLCVLIAVDSCIAVDTSVAVQHKGLIDCQV